MSEELKGPNPLIQEKHSLEPDMIFGWRPKQLQKKGPIPLSFFSSVSPTIVKDKKQEIYHGSRPVDSFQLHLNFKTQSDYKFSFDHSLISAWNYISKKNIKKYPDNRPFVGMSRSASRNALHFDSNFECGNLDKVVMISENKYDLYLRSDTNSRTRLLWFYFSVSNISYSRIVELNILNLTHTANIFDIGLRPMMYSTFTNKSNPHTGWETIYGNVRYKKSKINSHTLNPFFQLTIELDLTIHDEVYVALSKPYTCSDMYKFLDPIVSPYYKLTFPCETLGGLPLPLVTITDPSVPTLDKQYVMITSRLHPVDTYSSTIVEGLVKYLISEDPVARLARSALIFKIYPMANPDGVISGNTRCSLAGRDLNFCFKRPNPNVFPVTFYLKSSIKKLCSNNKVLVYFNIESNYKKKGSFMFGPYHPIHDSMYYMSRVIPKFFSDKTPMFRYFSCKFMNDPENINAPYRIFQREFSLLGFSLQSSQFAYINDNRDTAEYTLSDLLKLGEHLAATTYEYSALLKEQKEREKQRRKERIHKQRYVHQAKNTEINNIISMIEKHEENKEIESDIEKWTDDEEEVDEESLQNIMNAMDEFSLVIEDESKQNLPLVSSSNHKKVLRRHINEYKIPSEYVSRKRKEPSVFEAKSVKIAKCIFGPDHTKNIPLMPQLKPRIKRMRAKHLQGRIKFNSTSANSPGINWESGKLSSKNFPVPKVTQISDKYNITPSRYKKFGPFPSTTHLKNLSLL